jgi:hypothetical protein
MNTIIIVANISKNEFTNYWLRKFFFSQKTILMIALLIAVITIAVLGLIPPFFIQLSLMIFTVIPVFLLFKSSSIYRKNEILSQPITYTFSNENIQLKSDQIDTLLTYDAISKIEQTKYDLTLTLSSDTALIITQTSIKKTGKGDELILLLKSIEGLNFVHKA